MSADNNKAKRLQQVAKELNVGIHTIVEYLGKKGKKIDEKPNTKIDSDMYNLLLKAFQGEKKLKEASKTTKKTTKPVEIVLDATEVVKKEKEEREADDNLT
jgi:translation initiation factor IF-2